MLSKVLRSVCVLTALTVAAQADGLVTEVTVRQQGNNVKIVIPANGAVQHRARALDKSVVVDLFPAKMGSAVKTNHAVNRGLVSKVHVQQFNESTVRVTIDTSTTPSYQLTERGDSKGLVMAVSGMKPREDAQRRHRERKHVTCRFDNADLSDVLKFLAKEMGRNLYIGPGVKGSVTAALEGVPLEGAFVTILKMQETEYGYKMIEPNALIVAKPDHCGENEDDEMLAGPIGPRIPKDAIRQEILLKQAPAAKVIVFLESQYKDVRFNLHPTMNGFYATGSKRNILEIKSSVPSLDRVPDQEKQIRLVLKINYADLEEVKRLLERLVPQVTYSVDSDNCLSLEGPASGVQLARETLAQFAEESVRETWFSAPYREPPRSSSP